MDTIAEIIFCPACLCAGRCAQRRNYRPKSGGTATRSAAKSNHLGIILGGGVQGVQVPPVF